ncbi:hypothetical protein BCV72DRAFT_236617 [Rhizopus microsporus var. microsporus]|uniref:Secreted peptide n=1 Tax=Rhizopus microsporus var. microsporus TaxID=86635 RepID=A0A1X0QNL4_RHIZD|nr:hypothetical protein BCV72DRAFT_236617 [Rhizopus microsporus var. microsporus]
MFLLLLHLLLLLVPLLRLPLLLPPLLFLAPSLPRPPTPVHAKFPGVLCTRLLPAVFIAKHKLMAHLTALIVQ